MISEDIKIYLPKFLSTDFQNELFECLKNFPTNIITGKFYTFFLKEQDIVFQSGWIEKYAHYLNKAILENH